MPDHSSGSAVILWTRNSAFVGGDAGKFADSISIPVKLASGYRAEACSVQIPEGRYELFYPIPMVSVNSPVPVALSRIFVLGKISTGVVIRRPSKARMIMSCCD